MFVLRSFEYIARVLERYVRQGATPRAVRRDVAGRGRHGLPSGRRQGCGGIARTRIPRRWFAGFEDGDEVRQIVFRLQRGCDP